MIWFILVIAFAILAIYLHKSADKLDDSCKTQISWL